MQNDSLSNSPRQEWMSVLAMADWPDLDRIWQSVPNKPDYEILRQPETGLVMVRGRMGGHGQPFNTGEATATRCTVETSNGTKGHAYVLGRNKHHALAAAVLDAGLQDDVRQGELMANVIEPLKKIHAERREKHRRKVAATKVDFFTLVRGEDD